MLIHLYSPMYCFQNACRPGMHYLFSDSKMNQRNKPSLSVAFGLIDVFTLSSFLAWEAFLTGGNKLGLVWWAKVETHSPGFIYWFGPFLKKEALLDQLPGFLSDLDKESTNLLSKKILRCSCEEPLTVKMNNHENSISSISN